MQEALLLSKWVVKGAKSPKTTKEKIFIFRSSCCGTTVGNAFKLSVVVVISRLDQFYKIRNYRRSRCPTIGRRKAASGTRQSDFTQTGHPGFG